MQDFKVEYSKSEPRPSRFAVGRDTGSLYFVIGNNRHDGRVVGKAIIGKGGIANGEEQDLHVTELLPPGSVITIIT